jgi:hypothetical protein
VPLHTTDVARLRGKYARYEEVKAAQQRMGLDPRFFRTLLVDFLKGPWVLGRWVREHAFGPVAEILFALSVALLGNLYPQCFRHEIEEQP